jgi:hypothetical protein
MRETKEFGMKIVIAIPRDEERYMRAQTVADTLAAYLQGGLALRPRNAEETRALGPYRKPGKEFSWQLDASNNYFLHFNPISFEAVFTARYDSEQARKTMQSMAELFTVRYDIPHRIEH